MKRTANKVALETVLFTVGGLTEIKVLDRKNSWDNNPQVIFEGYEKDFGHNYKFWKYRRSAVHRIDIVDNCMVFVLETAYEEY